MKRRNNRFLAGTLAGLMMLTMLPVTALAAENGTADGTTTLTAESIAPVSETLNSSTANVVNDDKGSQNSGNSGAPTPSAEKNNESTDNNSTDKQDDSSSNTGENSDSNPSANNNGEGSENSTAEKPSRMTARTSRATAAPIRRETPTVILPPTTTAKAARTTRLPRRLPRKSAIRSMRRLMQQSTMHRTALRLRLVMMKV